MKITKSQLKRIIQEEVGNVLNGSPQLVEGKKEKLPIDTIPQEAHQMLIVIMGPPGCGNCRRALSDIKRVANKLKIPLSFDMHGRGWITTRGETVLKVAIRKWNRGGPYIYVSEPGRKEIGFYPHVLYGWPGRDGLGGPNPERMMCFLLSLPGAKQSLEDLDDETRKKLKKWNMDPEVECL